VSLTRKVFGKNTTRSAAKAWRFFPKLAMTLRDRDTELPLHNEDKGGIVSKRQYQGYNDGQYNGKCVKVIDLSKQT